jgi:hypothetical protein
MTNAPRCVGRSSVVSCVGWLVVTDLLVPTGKRPTGVVILPPIRIDFSLRVSYLIVIIITSHPSTLSPITKPPPPIIHPVE